MFPSFHRLLVVALIAVLAVGCEKPSALVDAAEAGDVEQVRRLLADGEDVDQVRRRTIGPILDQRDEATTAMHQASARGRAEAVEVLLAAGASLEIVDDQGATPLVAACRRGTIEVVRLLLGAGARAVPERWARGRGSAVWTPLFSVTAYPARRDQLAKLRAVLEAMPYGADERALADALARRFDGTDRGSVSGGSRPEHDLTVTMLSLWRAGAERGTSSFAADLEACLQQAWSTSDPDRVDEHGWTALLWATGPFGSVERVAALIDLGASPDVASARGFTPLMSAAFEGDAERVRLLLDAGAALDLQDDVGRTALSIAAREVELDVVRALLAAGTSPWPGPGGRPPLTDVERLLGYAARRPVPGDASVRAHDEELEILRDLLDEAMRRTPLEAEDIVLRDDPLLAAQVRAEIRVGRVRVADDGRRITWSMMWIGVPHTLACDVTLVHAGGRVALDPICSHVETFGRDCDVRTDTPLVPPVRLHLAPSRAAAERCGVGEAFGEELWFDLAE